MMDSLYADLIRLLIENYLDINSSLVLFCVSRKFAAYAKSYRETLLDAKKGWDYCIGIGNLAACQLLYHKTIENIEWLFLFSCQKGQLEIAKWLYELSVKIGPQINIHRHNESAFRWSCFNNHLEVVKWLVQLGQKTNSPINVYIKLDSGGYYWNSSYSPKIIQWLNTLE